MRIRPAQRVALRFGAVMALIGAVVLAGFAVLLDDSAEEEVRAVSDPSAIALPAPGLFGGSVTVYGAPDSGATPSSLGCRLLDRSGHEQSRAKMSELAAVSLDDVTLDGTRLEPLFVVRSYPSGASLECPQATAQHGLAISSGSTFGGNATLVRAVAGAGAVLFLVVALIGFVITRAPRD